MIRCCNPRYLERELPSGLVQRQGVLVTRKRWNELDPRVRKVILFGSAFETGLKIAALIDLARRSAKDVRGSKAAWAVAIALVNSGGAVPIAYLLRGRRVMRENPPVPARDRPSGGGW